MKLINTIASIITAIGLFQMLKSSTDPEFITGMAIMFAGWFIAVVAFLVEKTYGKFLFVKPKLYEDYYGSVDYKFAKTKKGLRDGKYSAFVKVKRIALFIYIKTGTEFIDYDSNFVRTN